jgi:predicted DNA-binding transcriptional regulator AlpA
MQPRIFRTRDAARYLGLAESTLEKWRVFGGGPRWVRLGRRAVGYPLSDLDDFTSRNYRRSTSDEGSPAATGAR